MRITSAYSERKKHDSVLRRRIKFVTTYPAMARLFRKGKHDLLARELFQRLKPSEIPDIRTRDDYDKWLTDIVEQDCWKKYSRVGNKEDRWAYFAKLINIVIYEIWRDFELLTQKKRARLHPFLHVPLDSITKDEVKKKDPSFVFAKRLKGMTRKDYLRVQDKIRQLAKKERVPPIWFEDAWSREEDT